MNIYKKLSVMMLVLGLIGCQAAPKKDDPVQPQKFNISDVGKGDIDMVAEVTVMQSQQYLKELASKLYRRNPIQLKRSDRFLDTVEIDKAVAYLFQQGSVFPQLAEKRSIQAILLAFDDAFQGDRVAAYIVGLNGMLVDAYDGEGEFFLHDQYDPQKLYYLARNYEAAAWRLRQLRNAEGQLFLLSNGSDAKGVQNLSFERVFGKLIALQDHFAQVVANTSNRQIKNVIQGVASMIFFPI